MLKHMPSTPKNKPSVYFYANGFLVQKNSSEKTTMIIKGTNLKKSQRKNTQINPGGE
jgi:hypothetical protein